MIAATEELPWPGCRPTPQVTILHPKSAQVWDAKDQAAATGISDATNSNLNAATVDYLAEVFDLYLALQHANVPVDIVEEEDLSREGLKDYHVLVVTAPNLPEEGQRGLAAWVRSGGCLVTLRGAGRRDRYDEAVLRARGCSRNQGGTGGTAPDRQCRPLEAGRPGQDFPAVGPRNKVQPDGLETLASFKDGPPGPGEKACR